MIGVRTKWFPIWCKCLLLAVPCQRQPNANMCKCKCVHVQMCTCANARILTNASVYMCTSCAFAGTIRFHALPDCDPGAFFLLCLAVSAIQRFLNWVAVALFICFWSLLKGALLLPTVPVVATLRGSLNTINCAWPLSSIFSGSLCSMVMPPAIATSFKARLIANVVHLHTLLLMTFLDDPLDIYIYIYFIYILYIYITI